MKTTTLVLAAIAVLVPCVSAVADDGDGDRIRTLEERVRALEARLARYESGGEEGLESELDRYLAEKEPALEVLDETAPQFVETGWQLSLSGQLWLLHNAPSSDLGFDAGRERTDMDYLYLFLSGETGPYGFRTWLGFRDSPRYTDASPYGRFWMHEALVYANLPVGDLDGDGTAETTTVEAGKVFVPFGVDWDHTWYGSVLYYKSMMFDSDWGARATGSVPVGEGADLSYGFALLTRSDELDGATTLAGFGLEGTGFQSPEFADDPGALDREQRDQWVARLALDLDLGDGLAATVGGSVLGGRIRQSVNDGSLRFHTGAFRGSRRQRDTEVDVKLAAEDVDLGLLDLPRAEALFENVWYDRGPANQSGRAYLAELWLTLYEDLANPYFRTIEVWYNYSADQARGQPDSHLHIPSFGMQLSERLRFMAEYVGWSTTRYMIDRGLYFHLSFDF